MRADTAWLKAKIEEIPTLATKTFVVIATPTAPAVKVEPPYVVIHPSEGNDDSGRLTGPAVARHPRWTLHGVGLSYDQAAWVGEQIKKKLLVGGFGITPTIAGEVAGRVWWTSPLPVQLDRDVTPPLCLHISECGFTSEPA